MSENGMNLAGFGTVLAAPPLFFGAFGAMAGYAMAEESDRKSASEVNNEALLSKVKCSAGTSLKKLGYALSVSSTAALPMGMFPWVVEGSNLRRITYMFLAVGGLVLGHVAIYSGNRLLKSAKVS